MLLPKRDWLILRARLRRFVSLAALPVMAAITMPACAAETSEDDESEEVATSSDALSKAGGIEVVQCNPFYAGAYERPDRSLPKTFATAKRFARKLAREHTHAAVIGMQEVETSGDADRVRDILNAETGRNWKVRWFNKHSGPNAVAATGEAIFWRPAVFDLVEDFGTKEVEAIDTAARREGKSVRFGGLLLRRKGTTRKLAVFTGKLAWWGTESDGQRIDNEDRAHQIAVLRRWIDEKTASHRRASRVVLMDMNAVVGSAPHKKMLEEYQDGGETAPTYFERGKKRLDYVFWDYDSGKKRPDGIFGKPVVSADFGSDHRFVAAKVYMRAEGE